jgi:hypothetical protein
MVPSLAGTGFLERVIPIQPPKQIILYKELIENQEKSKEAADLMYFKSFDMKDPNQIFEDSKLRPKFVTL